MNRVFGPLNAFRRGGTWLATVADVAELVVLIVYSFCNIGFALDGSGPLGRSAKDPAGGVVPGSRYSSYQGSRGHSHSARVLGRKEPMRFSHADALAHAWLGHVAAVTASLLVAASFGISYAADASTTSATEAIESNSPSGTQAEFAAAPDAVAPVILDWAAPADGLVEGQIETTQYAGYYYSYPYQYYQNYYSYYPSSYYYSYNSSYYNGYYNSGYGNGYYGYRSNYYPQYWAGFFNYAPYYTYGPNRCSYFYTGHGYVCY